MALLAIGQHKRLAAMHAILCLHLGLKVVRRNGVATMTTVVFCRLLASVVLRAFALLSLGTVATERELLLCRFVRVNILNTNNVYCSGRVEAWHALPTL
jgi:isoprenylcysteine carboxyl methyltransferase (ICMT) family protein YpbQ